MSKNFVEKKMGWSLEETIERIDHLWNPSQIQEMRNHLKRCERDGLYSPKEREELKDSFELKLTAWNEKRIQKAINKEKREEREVLKKWSDNKWVNKQWRKLKKKGRRKKTSLKKDKEA